MQLALAPIKPRISVPRRFLALLGVALIGVILFAVAAITYTNLSQTRDRLDDLSRDTAVGDAYGNMLTGVAEAIGYSQQFVATGDQQQALLTFQSIRSIFEAEARIKELGDDEDRALMTSMEEEYGPLIFQAQQLLQDPGLLGNAGIGDPFALSGIAAKVAPTALAKRERAAAELENIKSAFDSRSTGILVAFAISLPLLGVLVYLITRYERQEAVRVEQIHRMGQEALTDSLTGLGNHRAFQDDLRRELLRASRAEQALSIAIMDIDEFKVVNDTWGHGRGDNVLGQLGRLLTYMRGEDRCYRVGGDEFAIIMPSTDERTAFQALDALRQTVNSTIEGLTVSFGVSSNLVGESNASTLQEHADLALYEAKHRGKNQVVSYDLVLARGNEVTAAKMRAIRRVLESGEVSMVYQPILRPDPRRLLGYEALLRLPLAPELSGPQEAFDVAQRMGNSRDLDLLCTGRALDAARDLPSDLKMFINLDPATLVHTAFSANDLRKMVVERGIDPKKVVFEITEKTAVPPLRLARQIAAIQGCGFAMALDDVGSGNSGLEMMRMIKFDYVKIDRAVILDAMDGGPGRAIILAIVAFARESGAFMIAEGIENQAMLESVRFDGAGLHKFWVQGVQGFLFGMPRSSIKEVGEAEKAAA